MVFWREWKILSDCLDRLVSTLQAVDAVSQEGKHLTIWRGQNIRPVQFWKTGGVWHVGHPGHSLSDDPIATLSTPNRDVALRWLVYRTAYRHREEQNWPWLFPLRSVSGFAPGWGAEQTSEQKFTATVSATGRLVDSHGDPVDMQMATAFPGAIELAALSHLMELSPDDVLDSFLHPEGMPHLSHLIELGDPRATLGPDFQRLTQALQEAGQSTSTHEDGFSFYHWSLTHHFWLENGCWRFGQTERGEIRNDHISSTDMNLVLRWVSHKMLNIVRALKKWDYISAEKSSIVPGWETEELIYSYGRLISPDGVPLVMTLNTHFPEHEELNFLSHLMTLSPGQVIDSFLAEDGGQLHDIMEHETNA